MYRLTADFKSFTGRLDIKGANTLLDAFCTAVDKMPIVKTANRLTLERVI